MTLEDLARIGEFAGVIAVLVTLLYLTIQVRQSNRETRDQTAWRITESLNHFTTSITSDGAMADIWCRGNEDFESLSRIERERYVVLIAQWANVLIALYRTKDTSAVPFRVLEPQCRDLRDLLRAVSRLPAWSGLREPTGVRAQRGREPKPAQPDENQRK